jgi:hypothetical protein
VIDPFHTVAAVHLLGGWVDTNLGGEESVFAYIGDRNPYSRPININWRSSFLLIRQPRREADHFSLSSIEVKRLGKRWIISSLSHALLWRIYLFYLTLYFAQISESHNLQRIERCGLDQRLVLCCAVCLVIESTGSVSVCFCTEADVPRSQEILQ